MRGTVTVKMGGALLIVISLDEVAAWTAVLLKLVGINLFHVFFTKFT